METNTTAAPKPYQVALKLGEKYSEKFPGYIEMADGRLKRALLRKDSGTLFKYYAVVNCVCGKELLVSAYRQEKHSVCSDECKNVVKQAELAKKAAAALGRLRAGERFSESHPGYIEMPDGLLKSRNSQQSGWNYFRRAECSVCGSQMLQSKNGNGRPLCSVDCRATFAAERLRETKGLIKRRDFIEWQPDPRDTLGTREAWNASIEALDVINRWKRYVAEDVEVE